MQALLVVVHLLPVVGEVMAFFEVKSCNYFLRVEIKSYFEMETLDDVVRLYTVKYRQSAPIHVTAPLLVIYI